MQVSPQRRPPNLWGEWLFRHAPRLLDDGKLQDLFSLQDAIPEAKIRGYHGWAGRLGALVTSLDQIAAEHLDLLVPLRGPVIRDPGAAIERLQRRIRAIYANYLSIDALRWYFKDDHIRTKARLVMGPEARIDWMDMAETRPLPEAIIPLANSRLILAADGAGFLIDCGGAGVIAGLRQLRAAGKLTSVEHVFVTHYHDDHTDALPGLVAEFGAKIHACGSLVDLIERPGGCLVLNQHVKPGFLFSPAQVAQMRATLRRRIPLLTELLPFDDPNYGLDESWAVLHPYWRLLRPGESARLALRITNHSPATRTFRTALRAPDALRGTGTEPSRIEAHGNGSLGMSVQVPRDCRPGLYPIVADVSWEGGNLRAWTEAVIEVIP